MRDALEVTRGWSQDILKWKRTEDGLEANAGAPSPDCCISPSYSFLSPLLEFQTASDKTQNLPQGVPISFFIRWLDLQKPCHWHKCLPFAQISFLSCSAPIMASQGKVPNCIWARFLLGMWEEGLAKLFKGCPSLVPERGDTHFLGTSMEQFVSEGDTHTHPQKPRPESSTSFSARVWSSSCLQFQSFSMSLSKTRANSASTNATQKRPVVWHSLGMHPKLIYLNWLLHMTSLLQ